MARKYIQNCTGGDGTKKSSAKDRKISAFISRMIFHILLIGFLAVSVYVLFFSEYLRINNINITGTQELNSADIQNSFEEYFQGDFLKIIPKNNFLFISQKRVADLLKNNFKKIRTVTVFKKFPDSILINIDERKSVLVWCSGDNCFLIDENGTAYSVADFNSPEIVQNHLLRINDTSARDVAIGEKVIEPAYEQYVMGIKEALDGIGQKVSDDDNAYSTTSNMADEIDVKTNNDVQIYFSTQFSLDSAIHTLDVVLKKEITEDKLKSVEYIDLRSEGRVFYKIRSEEPEKPETQNSN